MVYIANNTKTGHHSWETFFTTNPLACN